MIRWALSFSRCSAVTIIKKRRKTHKCCCASKKEEIEIVGKSVSQSRATSVSQLGWLTQRKINILQHQQAKSSSPPMELPPTFARANQRRTLVGRLLCISRHIQEREREKRMIHRFLRQMVSPTLRCA